jgi:hypothetical protein
LATALFATLLLSALLATLLSALLATLLSALLATLLSALLAALLSALLSFRLLSTLRILFVVALAGAALLAALITAIVHVESPFVRSGIASRAKVECRRRADEQDESRIDHLLGKSHRCVRSGLDKEISGVGRNDETFSCRHAPFA